jgi:glycogen(starch) synthase
VRLDVLYVEGPGDIVAAFESWRAGREHASETSVTFSSQLFSHCRERGASLMALSYCGRRDSVRVDGWLVENLPRRMLRLPKVGYLLSLFWYAVRIGARAIRHRPRLIFLTSGVISWNMARALRCTGATVVPILHNALWPEGFAPARSTRGLAWWRSPRPPPTLVVSAAIGRQLATLSARAGARAIEFQPSFAEREFPAPTRADPSARPFRVLFVGRVEVEKGALDLVPIAQQLQQLDPGAYHIDVCGDGSQSAALAAALARAGLASTVTIRGRLNRAELIDRYRAAHVCIVPTRSSFSEGFAQVVAESILLQRPVITSRVVPASEAYASAVELAATDDVASYIDAIVRLARDRPRYERLADACAALRPQIFDRAMSFQSALGRVEQGVADEARAR